ncbi:hypothetical protein CVT24_002102 [Panaeolus cyanescens]|uniref:SURP motif domain-containing protein n=1 Tax=Panaeolus cyanescens TaxID=181874 RepID=A0A409YI66_9AGAR|nr:hypothetical protein CVT24_002102 [Panaeolus cyanescens]
MYNPNHSNRKRKYKNRGPQHSRRRDQEFDQGSSYQGLNYKAGPSTSSDAEGEEYQDPLRALNIEAHEATILRGPQAEAAAESLEVVEYYKVVEARDGHGGTTSQQTRLREKDDQAMARTGAAGVLIKLGSGTEQQSTQSNHSRAVDGQGHNPKLSIVDMDTDEGPFNQPGTRQGGRSTAVTTWVDRYDIRLLLDSLSSITNYSSSSEPLAAGASTIRASSPSGWSDLSSDAEDIFFFTAEESEDFRRDKRRRLIDQAREERLKQRLEEDGVDDVENDEHDAWGGSDEEPDEKQALLMTRTATHLAGSPNPAQLEMRILANHGADPRFAFLLPRGRWRRAWVSAKDEANRAKEKAANKEKQTILGGLAGYGSGSDDSGDESNSAEKEAEAVQPPLSTPPLPSSPPPSVPPPPPPSILMLASADEEGHGSDSAIKAERRKRAKEWAERRRALESESSKVQNEHGGEAL